MQDTRNCKKCKTKQPYHLFSKKGQVCFTCQDKKQRHKSGRLEEPPIRRKCLQCDKLFLSTGNRRCVECNDYYHDGIYSSVSSFISCG